MSPEGNHHYWGDGIAEEITWMSEDRYIPPAYTARVHAAPGQVDSALDELERAVAEHSFPLVFLISGPYYETLRAHTRFRALDERLGLS